MSPFDRAHTTSYSTVRPAYTKLYAISAWARSRSVPSECDGEAATLSSSGGQHAANSVYVKVAPRCRRLVVTSLTTATTARVTSTDIVIIVVVSRLHARSSSAFKPRHVAKAAVETPELILLLIDAAIAGIRVLLLTSLSFVFFFFLFCCCSLYLLAFLPNF